MYVLHFVFREFTVDYAHLLFLSEQEVDDVRYSPVENGFSNGISIFDIQEELFVVLVQVEMYLKCMTI